MSIKAEEDLMHFNATVERLVFHFCIMRSDVYGLLKAHWTLVQTHDAGFGNMVNMVRDTVFEVLNSENGQLSYTIAFYVLDGFYGWWDVTRSLVDHFEAKASFSN